MTPLSKPLVRPNPAPLISRTNTQDRAKDAGVGTSKAAKDAGDVRRFLNRLLGLPLGRQNLLFNYFAATLAAEIGAAKAEGRYSEGVSDLQVRLLCWGLLWGRARGGVPWRSAVVANVCVVGGVPFGRGTGRPIE